MLQGLKSVARDNLVDPASFWTRRARAAFGEQRPTLWLLASDGQVYTSEQQFAPLRRHADMLRRHFGVVLRFMPLARAAALSCEALGRFDVVGLKLGFRTRADHAADLVASFRERMRDGAKLVYFDGDDDL